MIPILKGNKYCVTGGAGFIGSHIAEQLVKQGKEVVVIDDLSKGNTRNFVPWWDNNLCTFHECDIATCTHLPRILDDCDAVFHNAAAKSVDCFDMPLKDLATNIRGSFCVFRAAAESKNQCKVIHASTGTVNDGNPKTYYGVSKYCAELYLHAISTYYPFRYTVLRYFHVYGPRQWSDKGGVIHLFVRRMLDDRPCVIEGAGTQLRHFTYVEDIVRANFMAAEQSSIGYGPYNVINPKAVSVDQLYWMLKDNHCPNALPPRHAPARPADRMYFTENSSELTNHGFGFKWDLDSGLKETWKYYEEQQERTDNTP